jgi:hypothetical protein
MESRRFGAAAGIAFGIGAVPLLHLSVVDLENKTATDSAYAAHVDDRYVSTSVAAGVGLLLVLILLVHLVWLSDLLAVHAPSAARVGFAAGVVTAGALAIGFVLSMTAAYGAHENFPDSAVRTVGMLAENLGTSLLVGLAVFAGVVAVLGWRGVLPRWLAVLGTLEVLLAGIATAVGVPAAAAFPTVVWVLLNSAGLALHGRGQASPADSVTRLAPPSS